MINTVHHLFRGGKGGLIQMGGLLTFFPLKRGEGLFERTGLGKEGHSLSRVNLRERLYEQTKVFIWRKVGPAMRVALLSRKGHPER